ncbi:MAG TPA: HAD family hydrolase [Dehalococcoidia bacterium]|nr:HAD family hydrolase [Dehalococcoidia bacterium]
MSRRLYLFDIDGTLLNSGGAGSRAMRRAFSSLWGVEDGFTGIEFSGRTDRVILRDAWAAHVEPLRPFEEDLQRFKRAYFRRLRSTLEECEGAVLPGVVETLAALADDPQATVALGTGNFRRGAELKLTYYGIWDYFCGGGFGDRAERREDMIAEALRACRPYGRFDTVFVIGDTVHDMTCAKAHGAVAVGVTTGPCDAAALEAAGADIVLDSLVGAARELR